MMETRLRDVLEELAEEMPARPVVPPNLRRDVRRRRALSAGLVVSGLAVVAGLGYVGARSVAGEPSPVPDASMVPGSAALVPNVVCDIGVTRADRTIAAEPDGVHLVVHNRTVEELGFDVRVAGVTGAPPGLHVVEAPDGGAWQLPAGMYEVGCGRLADDVQDWWFAEIRVVDPHGYWRAAELDCTDRRATPSVLRDPEPRVGTPEDVGVEFLAQLAFLEATDSAVRAGYPESKDAMVAIVRDGRVIATVELTSYGVRGWDWERAYWCTSVSRE